MSEDTLSWRGLARRLAAAVRLRFTESPPDCADCGYPMDRTRHQVTGWLWGHRTVRTWGNGYGRCSECAQLSIEAQRAELFRDVATVAKAALPTPIASYVARRVEADSGIAREIAAAERRMRQVEAREREAQRKANELFYPH